MDQFSSDLEIQELSMKSNVKQDNTKRKFFFFNFKGPPACGKTELMSRVCSYWAKTYALRQFSLLLYVSNWDLQQSCTIRKFMDRQFKGSTVSSDNILKYLQPHSCVLSLNCRVTSTVLDGMNLDLGELLHWLLL